MGLVLRFLKGGEIETERQLVWSVARGCLVATAAAVAIDLALNALFNPARLASGAAMTTIVSLLLAPVLFAIHGSSSLKLLRVKRELERLARIDGQTGLLTRGAFIDAFMAAASPKHLLIADIDEFKRINDRHGHPVGDAVIAAVADAIVGALPSDALVGRFGGEEYAIGIVGRDAAAAIALAEAARAAVGALSLEIEGGEGAIGATMSVGAASADGSFSAAYRDADRALYRAKAAGRNRTAAAWEATRAPPAREPACA